MDKVSKRRIDPDLASQIPKFKSEREEAEFWDANEDLIMDLLRRHGKAVQPGNVTRTKAISLRVDVDLIEKAKKIAAKQGLGYQTVLKQAIRNGLRKAG